MKLFTSFNHFVQNDITSSVSHFVIRRNHAVILPTLLNISKLNNFLFLSILNSAYPYFKTMTTIGVVFITKAVDVTLVTHYKHKQKCNKHPDG